MDERVVLRTIGGAVPFLLASRPPREVASMRLLERAEDWAMFSYAGPIEPLAAMRTYESCGVLLEDAAHSSLLASVRPSRFRVGPLADRFALRDRIAAQFGWVNDPSNWDVNVEKIGRHVVVTIGALHVTARLGTLVRAPASTRRVLAAVLVMLAGCEAGHVVLDAFCGTGTILAEVGSGFGLDRDVAVAPAAVADAAVLPIRRRSVDRVISNLPFGRRVGSHASNVELYPAFLRELHRVLRPGGRAVLLTNDKRLLREHVKPLRIESEHVFTIGGLHPSAFVLTRPNPRG